MKQQLNKLTKSIALVITLAAICTTGYAQINDSADGDTTQTNTTLSKEKDEQELVRIIKNEPEFPGGLVGLSKYIKKNLKYPEIAKKNGISGKVFVRFVINQKGEVEPESVKIVRGIDTLLDAEAIRVVKSMPKWKPATQRGKPVKFAHTIAVEFK